MKKSFRNVIVLLGCVSASILSACNSDGSTAGAVAGPSAAVPGSPGGAGGGGGGSTPPVERSYKTDVLLYEGSGAWSTEVDSLKNILEEHGATYRAVDEREMAALSLDDLATYGLILFPGGSGGTESNSIGMTARLNIRKAVRERGVSYLGFCAGAWIAAAPEPGDGKDAEYGLGIVNAPVMETYYLDATQDLAMLDFKFADGTTRQMLYYGGPVTTSSGVVARYPNNDPAISQAFSGKGFVMMSAIHPAAPQSFKSEVGLQDKDGDDFDIAWKLIETTLHQQPLQAQ